MNKITDADKAIIDSNIKLQKEIKLLRNELQKVTIQRDSIKETLDAIVTAFFRSGAKCPNVTEDCFESKKTYEIVQNDGFFTIKRTEEEVKIEGESQWFIVKELHGRKKNWL